MFKKSDDIIKGMMMTKDCSDATFVRKDDTPTIAEIQVRLARFKQKLDVLQSVVGNRRVH